jgi:hypothetical protein
MTKFWLLLFVGILAPCIGCYVSSTTSTSTEEIGIAGPSRSGDQIDPNLYLRCILGESYKVTFWDNAEHELYSQTMPAGTSSFKIGIEDGNLVLKSNSGQTLAQSAISAKENASLRSEILPQPDPHQSKRVTFRLKIEDDPQAPVFILTVDRGSKKTTGETAQ